MAAPHVKLANSLAILKAVQEQSGPIIELAKHKELTRVHRERLVAQGFIVPVIQGWYLAGSPGEPPGSTTAWYAHLDQFVAAYANSRFGHRWQAAAEVSVLRHSGETGAIRQLLIQSPDSSNMKLDLLHGCSIFLSKVKESTLSSNAVPLSSGLRVLPLEEALVTVSPHFFVSQALAAQIAMRHVEATELSRVLLAGSHTSIAGRMAGALRAVGRPDDADSILSAMRAAGHRDVRENNPFEQEIPSFEWRQNESPHVQRIRAMWAQMRPVVIEAFRDVPRLDVKDVPALLQDVEARYQADAYHSLSIEGFQVTDELIQRVRTGNWRPEGNPADREIVNAMNARGYFELHRHILGLIERVLGEGVPVGELFKKDLPDWYRTMYGPSVQAGIVPPEALAGYRNHPIYIRNARHVPPAPSGRGSRCPCSLSSCSRSRTQPCARSWVTSSSCTSIRTWMATVASAASS